MLRFLLEAHEPYPAFVLDRYWDMLDWNRPQAKLLHEIAAEDGSPAGINALDLVFQPGPIRSRLLNWEEVALAVLRRLRRQITRLGKDRRLQEIWQTVQQAPGVSELSRREPAHSVPPVMVPMRVQEGDQTLIWFNTLSSFGSVEDATLEDLVIASFFPGDTVTRNFVETTLRVPSGLEDLPTRD